MQSAVAFKEYERTVTVKGLSEREVPADVVIWPVQFTVASNSLEEVYTKTQESAEKIKDFMMERGLADSSISFSSPELTDKSAQAYGGADNVPFRYVINQTVTVYTDQVTIARQVMTQMSELGKQGIALTGNMYQNRTEYKFNGLNEIKPEMIEEATKKAREVAVKFAEDSNSELGKIKTAYQGQFTINPRDQNNPHIKNVRVVSTVVYYLSD
jgi:hypothetical protein